VSSDIATYPLEADERWRQFPWTLIPLSHEEPAMNLALDEVLTRRIGRGERGPTLRLWGWSAMCVVIGSGGGAMFIEPDNAITWSLYVPRAFV
jgi:lipoate-protein ligase A